MNVVQSVAFFQILILGWETVKLVLKNNKILIL